jgi:Phage integrase family
MARPSHCTHRRLPRRGVRTDTTCLKRHSSPGCHSRFRPRSTLGSGAAAVLEDPGEARRAFSGCPPVLHQFRRLPRPQQLELDRPPRCRRHRVPLGPAARAAPHRSHVGCGDRRHHPGADAPAGHTSPAAALLETIKGDRLDSLFRVMLATGLRRGEALGLHWSDVDLDAALLRVRWTLSRRSQGLRLDEPKTDKSRRTVPLPRSAVEALRANRPGNWTKSTRPQGPGRSTAWSSPPRSGHPSSPATSCGASRFSLSEPASAASPCTLSGTPQRASCWRPEPTPRSSRSTSGTRRTPSRPTSTATSVPPSNARRQTGSTRHSAGDRCCTRAALLYPLLYSCERRAAPHGRPASDLRFLCRADRI